MATSASFAVLTDVGLRRAHNEDAVAAVSASAWGRERPGIVLADGMGGHNGGEVASAIVLETLHRRLSEGQVPPEHAADEQWQANWSEYLVACIAEANEAVFARSIEEPGLSGMGSTLAIALLMGDWCCAAWVGDSRVYRYRDGELVGLTVDHAWREEQYLLGELTEQEIEQDPRRDALSRAVGIGRAIEPSIVFPRVVPGDLLLVCSDGLSRYADGVELAELLAAYAADELEQAARELVDFANLCGGVDNISVGLLRVHEDASSALPEPVEPEFVEGTFEWAVFQDRARYRVQYS